MTVENRTGDYIMNLEFFAAAIKFVGEKAPLSLLMVAIAMLLASMATYCLQVMQPPVAQIIVGGGLLFSSACFLVCSALVMVPNRRRYQSY